MSNICLARKKLETGTWKTEHFGNGVVGSLLKQFIQDYRASSLKACDEFVKQFFFEWQFLWEFRNTPITIFDLFPIHTLQIIFQIFLLACSLIEQNY